MDILFLNLIQFSTTVNIHYLFNGYDIITWKFASLIHSHTHKNKHKHTDRHLPYTIIKNVSLVDPFVLLTTTVYVPLSSGRRLVILNELLDVITLSSGFISVLFLNHVTV